MEYIYFIGNMLIHQHIPVGKASSMYLLVCKYNQRDRGYELQEKKKSDHAGGKALHQSIKHWHCVEKGRKRICRTKTVLQGKNQRRLRYKGNLNRMAQHQKSVQCRYKNRHEKIDRHACTHKLMHTHLESLLKCPTKDSLMLGMEETMLGDAFRKQLHTEQAVRRDQPGV